ncbi:YdcF family protein [Microlunatus flavus]|uniref:Uncharacterized SAM-binding protein YcdF, DUF218 family n=1 Tax=Microlunatus flavus TaxID=1036181 RepID=A0A1H9GBU4_9ACTN|nr:YdcF family protein [Microlunatus flavus]SEQ47562.1 Uncharacterized SAM-binding protein YcdF, DUF218 family [Microlunatus flavus]
MASLVIGAVFGVLYVVSRNRDRRLLRNGVFLVAAAWFVLVGAVSLLAEVVPGFAVLVVVLVALAPAAVLVLAVFAIVNGVTVIRAEGLSPGTSLSLAAGVALLLLPVAGVALFLTRNPLGIGAAALLFLLSGYAGVVFVVFLVYSVVYGRVQQHGVRPAALVVLGSRIIDGRVPPLLASRLDRALAIYRREAASGTAPLLIPSGGKGDDETRAEGAAMADYLLARGVPPEDVRPETESRTTRENLVLSARVQQAAGRDGPALAVTNNYHVLRAAILARQIGTDTQVVGAPTARYYVPSAFLREFVAVVVEHKRLHLLLVVPFVALTVLGMLALYFLP